MILIHESHEGRVEHVADNSVVVVYNVNGNVVEQTYERKQFLNGKLPKIGTCIRTSVVVVEYDPPIPQDEPGQDKPTSRKPLEGPINF